MSKIIVIWSILIWHTVGEPWKVAHIFKDEYEVVKDVTWVDTCRWAADTTWHQREFSTVDSANAFILEGERRYPKGQNKITEIDTIYIKP